MNWNKDTTIGLLLGMGLGFASCYLLIKSGTIVLSPLQQSETQRKHGFMGRPSSENVQDKDNNNPLANWRPLGQIPSIDKLDEFTPIPLDGYIQELQCEPQTNDAIVAQAELPPGTVHYKNSEKMKVIRGPDKRIIGYETDRDAKISE